MGLWELPSVRLAKAGPSPLYETPPSLTADTPLLSNIAVVTTIPNGIYSFAKLSTPCV